MHLAFREKGNIHGSVSFVTSAASSSGITPTTSSASSTTATALHARLLGIFALLASDRLVVEALGAVMIEGNQVSLRAS